MTEPSVLPRAEMRALLIGAYVDSAEREQAQSLLDELEELVNTLGVPIEEKLLVHHREAHARLLLGSGKAEEIAQLAEDKGCKLIVFDNELTPSQQRNWEKLTSKAVIDRQEVILDIFAQRARTREARLQVELAQAEYALPRLTRAWGHLVRQGGGIGGRGEGESQLEQDKRRLRGTIDRLKKELAAVRSARATQRKDRQRTPVPNAAIVGYTNAGKSSLLRRLTGAEVLVENKLFATLDTTTRRVDLPNKQPLLLTDTVGFVRRLPHDLVESFNATLEESVVADFLIHVVDGSQPSALEFFNTTRRVLDDLGAGDKPTAVVFNKMDRVTDESTIANLRRQFPDAIFASVHSGEGLDLLLNQLSEWVANAGKTRELRLPTWDGATVARLHREAQVHEIEYLDSETRMVVTMPQKLADELVEFWVERDAEKAELGTDSSRDKAIARH